MCDLTCWLLRIGFVLLIVLVVYAILMAAGSPANRSDDTKSDEDYMWYV